MNDPKKPELTSFGQFAKCRRIMRSEDHTTMNNLEEKQLATAVNPAALMQISTDVASVFSRLHQSR
jgi:hypothetical protein